MIQRANELNLPVITATQMLGSMIEHPIPTRAEASDVANAILDGTGAVMLSGETAVGQWPVQTVQTMARIAVEAERAMTARPVTVAKQQAKAITRAARTIAGDLGARAIIVFTQAGYSAKAMSQERARLPVFAFTPDLQVSRALALWYGVTPVHMGSSDNVEVMVAAGISRLRKLGLVDAGDTVVIVGSAPKLVGGLTNMLTVRTVDAR